MKRYSRIGAVGAALALAGAAAGFAMVPAGAAGSFSSPLTGSLELTTTSGPSVLDISNGSMVSGVYDADAGTLTGNVSIGAGSTTVDVAAPINSAVLHYSFTETGGIQNGTVGDDGSVSFTDIQTMNLTQVDALGQTIPLPATCTIGPLSLAFSGTYDADSGTVAVETPTITVPAPGDCGALDAQIRPIIEGATVAVSVQFDIGTADGPSPTVTAAPTTTPGTTVPGGQGVTFTGPFTTDGCDASIPIHFDQGGAYTVEITTTNDRVIGSTDVDRDGPGDETVIVSVDPNHGTEHGDPLNVTVLDANDAVIAVQEGSVDDPDACTPGSSTTKPADDTKPLATPPASPAAPVSAQPAFTG